TYGAQLCNFAIVHTTMYKPTFATSSSVFVAALLRNLKVVVLESWTFIVRPLQAKWRDRTPHRANF
ncbi:hypothetical protein AVEN_134650-1, partial [Araneus ventricosus]